MGVELGLLVLALGRAMAAETETARVGFDTSLNQPTDLSLAGVHAERVVHFTRPSTWELTADPVIELTLSHSEALLPERSHLTVLVNDHAVGSLALTSANASTSTWSVTVPRRLLEDYNHLRLAVDQHYTDGCEDPFDPALWTRVSHESAIRFEHRPKPVAADLSTWPSPLVDKLGYGPTELSLLTGPTPGEATLAAASTLSLAIGRLSDYHGVHVTPPVASLDEAVGNVVAIGTLDELPGVAPLLGDTRLQPDEGAVALLPNPSDPTLAVLVVTGGGPEGVKAAARALSASDRYALLSGPVTVIRSVAPAPPPPSPRTRAPDVGDFTLRDLGLGSQTSRGYYAAPVSIPVRLSADTKFRPGNGTLHLHYAYSAQLDDRLSTVEVLMEGLTVRSLPLSNREGASDLEVAVPLPEDLLHPDMTVEVIFHLFPRDFDLCRHVADTQIWGSVLESTRFELARDHVADMPDLGLLRREAWPFTLDAATAPVTVVLPDQPTAAALSAGFRMVAGLGAVSEAKDPDVRLVAATPTRLADEKDRHVIVLADGTPHATYAALADGGKLTVSGAPTGELRGPAAASLLQVVAGAAYGAIEELVHPDNPTRAVLSLHHPSTDGLVALVETVVDPARVTKLFGNAAVQAEDGSLRTVDLAEKVQWGKYPVATAAQVEIRENWWTLAPTVIGGAFGVAALAGAYVGLRKRR